MNRIVNALALTAAGIAAAITISAAPANATRYHHHKVSVEQYSSVYQRDEKLHVEIVWGMEGHRTNQWTGPLGEFRTKTYPATVAGDEARATYLHYTPFANHPNQKAWILYSTKWCVPNADPAAISPFTCSQTPPA